MLDRFTTALRIGATVLLVGCVVLVAIVALPSLAGGANSYVVLSESMEPTLTPGDAIVVRSAPPSAVEEGDVITYRAPGSVDDADQDRITHRVVEKRQTESGVAYRTKGDANDRPDPTLVPHERVVGAVWFHVPAVGRLVLFAQRPLGLVVLLIGPGVLLLASGLRQLATAVDGEPSGD
ncbi:signal peptidase I [Halorubrum sp. FL23]|uniref:signal peptidase I n=1 Tax=Halorubrum sp. FL23 TaxID=3458704 RepID=UPI004034D074